jgi:phosphocarrier protein
MKNLLTYSGPLCQHENFIAHKSDEAYSKNMNRKKSDTPVVKGMFVVKNDRGLHTRPATELVKLVAAYRSEVHLKYRNKSANAKSLLGILIFAASKGAKIYVEAKGEDAEQVVKNLEALASNNFNITY